ncbi:unnamed protein product [Meganyctiphanes norvegica]|uniref:Structural maintenance of chromosomes protein n=1 Tax=Meganyctiphanes norvegica TaxID=48144 RepID=A0AAV2RNP9_MEGNR
MPSDKKAKNKRNKEEEKEKENAKEKEAEVVEDVPMEEEDDHEDEPGGIRIGDIYLPPPPPPACTFDSNGPRLIITHIENEFFKSYAGRQVLGPFHKSFTSIVGPNGSGKSNVIDSMLFVFGYRANKIRLKKLSGLIHNSEQHSNVQSCTVAVHFQSIIDKDGDDFEVVPNSKLVVARTAYKDNTSYYTVDGKRCQFKVVAKLLRAKGIDLDHNRFLILQGEVEQIAMMKPKALTEHDTGMLEFLEDIVGSSRFMKPIELLSKRVEELNEQRQEKLNRVKLVEKEKDELEEPKEAAVAHLRLENEITVKNHRLYQRYILDCTRTMDKAVAKKQEIDDGMSDVKKQLEELGTKKKEKGEEIKKLGGQLEKISKAKEEYSEKFKGLESEDQKLQEDMKHKNLKRKKLIGLLKTETEKLEELERVPEKNEKDIEECKKLKERLEGEREKEQEEYHKVMATLNSETQTLQEEKKQYETRLIDLRKTVNETKSVVDISQSELDIYQSTEKSEKKKLEQIESGLKKAQETINSRKDQVEKLKQAVPDSDQKLRAANQNLLQVSPQLGQLEQQLRSQRVLLEEKRSSMQSSHSHNRVLDFLMEQKRNGNIPGVFGRLGDLGGIDAKYDIAISTACGPLDNIVVDNIDTAQACIEALRRSQVGSGTFIALDKQEKWRRNAESTIQTPENVPRLFDLVKINDPRVSPAFYFALRDTLVATDMEQASRIAYGKQRRRVVTLKGELIETSGTMSGGGNRPNKGRMGRQAAVVEVDPKEVERIEINVEELMKQQGELRREKSQHDDTIHQLTKDLKIMKADLQKFGREVAVAEQQIEVLEAQVEGQRQKAKDATSDPKKVKEMEKIITDKLKLYKEASAASEKDEEAVQKINNQIKEVTGSKMKGVKKKLDTVSTKLEKVTAEITKLQVAIKTAQRNTKKTKDKITEMETEKLEGETELKGMTEKRTAIEEKATKVLEELQAATKAEEERSEKVAEIKSEYEEIVSEENKIKASKIEIDQELEKYENIIKENKSKASHWKRQMGKLDLTEIPFSDPEEEEDKMSLDMLEEAALDELDPKQLQYQLTMLQEKLAQSKPNLAVIQEYKKKEEVYLSRVVELDEITRFRDEQRKYHEDLRKQRLNEFMSGFTIISNKLKEMYQMITLGGDAELELVDSLDPFSEGIVFSVRPPKKSWKNITNLSGGEKTLSSLALVFALHYYKPTPLYVMDEIDAALDFKNVSIVGNYIKERTKNAQFIIISLRSQMFELADRLVGIYKTYNATKSVTINPSKFGVPEGTEEKDVVQHPVSTPPLVSPPPVLGESKA